MSKKQEIVDGYLSGSISRRTFVRRLTAAGLSVGAAISYAELLGPSAAHARPGHQPYYASGFYEHCNYYDGFYVDCVNAPGVETEAPANVEQTSALAQASIDPNNGATNFHFSYRPVGSLGALQTEDGGLAGGDGYTPVSLLLSGLAPGTDYQYRVVANNVAGKTTGQWVTFTTLAASQSGSGGSGGGGGGNVAAMAAAAGTMGAQPPLTNSNSRAQKPRISLGHPFGLSTAHRDGTITVPLVVDQDATVRVHVKKGVRKAKRRALFAAKSARLVDIVTPAKKTVKAGKPKNVKLRLDRTGRRLLAGKKPVRVLIEIRAVNDDGLAGVLSTTLHIS